MKKRRKKGPRGAATPSGANVNHLHRQFNTQIPEEQEKMQKIQRLFQLALQVNSLEARKKETTGELPTAFADYSGHVSIMTFRVHPNGWAYGEAWEEKELDISAELDRFNEQYEGIHSWLLQYKEVAG